ncbi:MAG: HNH endonuclease [Pirellulaceae bacterium]
MDTRLRDRVRERARNRCEYCGLLEEHSPVARLQIEHIVPLKHGGTSHFGNLALACIDCNLRKGTNLTGIDPESGAIVRLFHPRQQTWADHFERRGEGVWGYTPD